MNKVEAFLSPKEESEVVHAIKLAEKQTSGEIRVHLENSENDVELRAKEVFHLLKMNETKDRNAVIVYVAVNQKQFYIYGDQGIHLNVGNLFWESTRDIILGCFKEGNYAEGLSKGILEIGRVLKEFFPWEKTDTNELSDEISKG